MIKKVIDIKDWERIESILNNLQYWDTCPQDYIDDIETILEKYKNKQRSD